MRKRVVRNGVVRWEGKSDYPYRTRSIHKSIYQPDPHRKVKPETERMFGEFLTGVKKKTFTQRDFQDYSGYSDDVVRRILISEPYGDHSTKLNRTSHREYDTKEAKVLYNETAKGSYRVTN